MTSRRKPRLNLESLERRDVPASFGIPWADPLHLTASFAPDGTSLQTDTSGLNALLESQGLGNTGKQQVLKALQSWIAASNINVGLVEDGGQAFGTGGAIQGDRRFGDIRLGSLAMNSNKLAETQPHDVIAGTWAGDILLNSNAKLGIGAGTEGYDLYTVYLQEFGHALGLANSESLDSVMYDHYQTARLGLSAGDISAIQHLYGVRLPDAYDAQDRNDTFGNATTLSIVNSLTRTLLGTSLNADITNSSDVDYYKFSAGLGGWTTITLKTNGISLLTSQLDLYSSTLQRLGGTASYDPVNGNLRYRFFAELGKSYFLRVGGSAGTDFNVGAYQLQIVPDGLQVAVNLPSYLPEPLAGLNDTFLTATNLSLTQTLLGSDTRYDYAYREAIATTRDVDFYRISVPGDLAANQVLNVTVWNLDNSTFRPKATLFDGLGRAVDAQVVVNEDGSYGIQAEGNWRAGATYYVKVESNGQPNSAATGRYFLGIDFNQNYADFATVVPPTSLAASDTPDTGSLIVTENSLIHLVLSSQTSDRNQGVKLSVFDSTGKLVSTLLAFGNDTTTSTIWLRQDSYRVVFEGTTRDGSAFRATTYSLKIKGLSDSIDPYDTDPNAPGSGGTVTPPPENKKPTYTSWYYVESPPPSPTRTF